MQSSFEEFLSNNPNATSEDFLLEFGKPEQLASSLVDNMSGDDILQVFQKRRKKNIIFMFLVIAAAIIIAFGIMQIIHQLLLKKPLLYMMRCLLKNKNIYKEGYLVKKLGAERK